MLPQQVDDQVDPRRNTTLRDDEGEDVAGDSEGTPVAPGNTG